MPAAALPCTPQAHPRLAPLSSPPSRFVPSRPRRLTANSFQSPYFYRASGSLQIAVSAPLRTSSVEAREVPAEEHCRYGTRDLSLIEELATLTTVDRSIAISSAGLLHFSHANARESVSIAESMIGFATFSASWPFANITTPDFLAGSAITKALKTPLSPQCQSMTLLCSR